MEDENTKEIAPKVLDTKDIFDGVQFGPEFALALKDFIKKNLSVRIKYGSSSVTLASGGTASLAHGLGVTPNLYGINPDNYCSNNSPITSATFLSLNPANPPDATNLYLINNGNGLAAISFYWFAAYLPS